MDEESDLPFMCTNVYKDTDRNLFQKGALGRFSTDRNEIVRAWKRCRQTESLLEAAQPASEEEAAGIKERTRPPMGGKLTGRP